jgi:hypothetical protein
LTYGKHRIFAEIEEGRLCLTHFCRLVQYSPSIHGCLLCFLATLLSLLLRFVPFIDILSFVVALFVDEQGIFSVMALGALFSLC